MISPLSWMPIAMMVLGVEDQPVFFLSAVAAALTPILLTLLTAVHHFDPLDIKVARSMAAEPQGHFSRISRIGLPTICPNHLACVRVSVDLIWLVLVRAVKLGESFGLGG
jgi:NitT/TauT family transport system permease protein